MNPDVKPHLPPFPASLSFPWTHAFPWWENKTAHGEISPCDVGTGEGRSDSSSHKHVVCDPCAPFMSKRVLLWPFHKELINCNADTEKIRMKIPEWGNQKLLFIKGGITVHWTFVFCFFCFLFMKLKLTRVNSRLLWCAVFLFKRRLNYRSLLKGFGSVFHTSSTRETFRKITPLWVVMRACTA